MKCIIKKIIILYQRYISPMKGRTCRFYPTCSAYSLEAIEKLGVFRGSIKSIWRILRCNPFNAGGYDPVEKNKK
ncbi:membrane protein insertion efficiency factor YidD [Senegalia massiliensis]|uniref:membrane protein insertion efficiency factor YidD n=1 Tax=Senegalia massiliensis TaxID=1720316 RepID=UPI0010313498|nr:membrane protein insertion efficiency factor YidD [Senegalia massiliensis]